MSELGSNGKFIYLVRDTISDSLLQIHDCIARTLREQDRPEKSVQAYEYLNQCLKPYVGKTLLRCGIWWDGLRHEMYIDETEERVVHRSASTHPDPDDVVSDDSQNVE